MTTTRLARPCPSCGKIFEPRKVGGRWTKTCGERACVSEAIAKAMREGGGRKASLARKLPEHVELVCEICGHGWTEQPSQVKGRRTCSIECAAELKRRAGGAQRRGEANPNHRHGKRAGVRDRAGERRWYAALADRCEAPRCGSRDRLALHHVCYAQHVRREDGDVWEPMNALTLCASCHSSHHRRGRVLPVSALREANVRFAVELLGGDRATEYLRRYYRDDCDEAWWLALVAGVPWTTIEGATG